MDKQKLIKKIISMAQSSVQKTRSIIMENGYDEQLINLPEHVQMKEFMLRMSSLKEPSYMDAANIIFFMNNRPEYNYLFRVFMGDALKDTDIDVEELMDNPIGALYNKLEEV